MKHTLSLLAVLIALAGCRTTTPVAPVSPTEQAVQTSVLVSTAEELDLAITNAGPGTEIVMADGNWDDIRIRFVGRGTAEQPITLRAETPGRVVIRGQSDLRLGGEYLVVDGLYFTQGASPSGAVIQFFVDDELLANHSRVTNSAIVGFNKSQRDETDLWVRFRGRHNQLDRNYIAGKSNRGPTVRVDLEGNPSINNYHRINDNHFGPRPPKGGPSAETIQIGDSRTSMSPSHTLVEGNLFERRNGEVEVISSKSNFNEFRDNVFYLSEGSLVTRHGNYATVDGNLFIGDGVSPHIGGIRLIGTGHWVTNNYFYNLRSSEFRAPIALMNGIPRPAINRYFQVTDVVIAHNTWVNTTSPWQLGVGSNVDQRDVLPDSEIRSETPIRTLIANNAIYNAQGDAAPIVRYDEIDGVEFRNNVIDNQGVPFDGVDGLLERDVSMTQAQQDVWIPSSGLAGVDVYHGFEFDRIERDVFGNPRAERNAVGATSGAGDVPTGVLDLASYGPDWYEPGTGENPNPVVHRVGDGDELRRALAEATGGDVVELTAAAYTVDSPLEIDKRLTVRSADPAARSQIVYSGGAQTPAFEMHPGGYLVLKSVVLRGGGDSYAFAPLKENMSSLYNLEVSDSDISGFDFVLKAHKHSFAEFVRFESTTIENCANGIELSAEDDDRGDYNAENVYVIDSTFRGVGANVVDYYRGGYDESTVGGNLIVRGSTFVGSGSSEDDGILIDTYGIINVDLSNNTFRDNDVRLVARLWGAKNNRHAGNVIRDSGEIVVEQNLPQKLVY